MFDDRCEPKSDTPKYRAMYDSSIGVHRTDDNGQDRVGKPSIEIWSDLCIDNAKAYFSMDYRPGKTPGFMAEVLKGYNLESFNNKDVDAMIVGTGMNG